MSQDLDQLIYKAREKCPGLAKLADELQHESSVDKFSPRAVEAGLILREAMTDCNDICCIGCSVQLATRVGRRLIPLLDTELRASA